MFLIRDILVRIRMRIRILQDPALFVSDLQEIMFSNLFLCLFLFEGSLTSFFKDEELYRSHKTVDIKVFLHFLLVYGRIRIRSRIRIRTDKLRIQEAQKHTDPTDPEH